MVREYINLVTENLKPGFCLAEIGVFTGGSTVEILSHLEKVGGLFVGVDSWEADSENTFLMNIEPWRHICDIRSGVSWEVSQQFLDHSFDMVYIDAGHRYSSVIQDIRAWLPKVKVGGILAGHDYNSEWDGNMEHTDDEVSDYLHYGVSRAVKEVFGDSFVHNGYPYECQTWSVIIKEGTKYV